jgi:hypothetical protein
LDDLTDLLNRLALAEYYLRKSLAQTTMVVYLGKTQILVWEVPQQLHPFIRADPLLVEIFKQLT